MKLDKARRCIANALMQYCEDCDTSVGGRKAIAAAWTVVSRTASERQKALAMLKAGVADFENRDTNATVTWADRAKALIKELELV